MSVTAQEALDLIAVFDAILMGRQSGQKLLFVWDSDCKYLTLKLNFTQFVNQNVQILGRRLFSPGLKDVAWLEDPQFNFF